MTQKRKHIEGMKLPWRKIEYEINGAVGERVKREGKEKVLKARDNKRMDMIERM